MKNKIAEITRSQHAIKLLDALFDRPIFQAGDIVTRTELAKQTVMPLLRKLKDGKVLTTIRESQGRQPAILAFPELVNITEGRKVLSRGN